MENIINKGLVYLDRRKKKGAALKEIDAFLDLNAREDHSLIDHLRGVHGRTHGDWARADIEANACLNMMNALTRGETGFQELAKRLEKGEQPAADDSGLQPDPA